MPRAIAARRRPSPLRSPVLSSLFAVVVAPVLPACGSDSNASTPFDPSAQGGSSANGGASNGGSSASPNGGTSNGGSVNGGGTNNGGTSGNGGGGSSGAPPLNTDDYAVGIGNAHTCVIGVGKLYCFGNNEGGQIGDGTKDLRDTPFAVLPSVHWKRVSGGGAFTCALDDAGMRYCWGNGGYGQIGNGLRDEQLTPFGPIDGPWTQIAAGGEHACGIKADQHLFCWGSNSLNVLGVDGIDRSADPVEPVPTKTFSAVSTGPFYTCAIQVPGSLWCWGVVPAQTGQAIVRIGTAEDWIALDSGQYASCGIRSDRGLWCWGYGFTGFGNDGVFDDAASPVQVGTEKDWVGVRVGAAEICASKADGALYCWGWNGDGEVGIPVTDESVFVDVPTRVATPANWNAFDVGGYIDYGTAFQGAQAAGFDASGTLYTWGDGRQGQLGNGDSGHAQYTPAKITDETFVALGSGQALKADGSSWWWGPGSYAWMARPTGGPPGGSVRHLVPEPFQTGVARFAGGSAAGNTFSNYSRRVWVGTDGALWGERAPCPDPYPSQGYVYCPATSTAVGTDKDWDQVAADWKNTCAIKKSGALYCWGLGPIGNGKDGVGTQGTTYDTPQPIAAGKTWKAISIGQLQICGIQTDGSLWCWGQESYGELGTGMDNQERLSPSRVGTAVDWVAISAGQTVTCALKQGGALYCWGWHGYTGRGATAADTNLPTPTLAGQTFQRIDATENVCALRSDGTLWCWGSADFGQVGIRSTAWQYDPIQVGTDTDWVEVRDEQNGTCARKKDGTVWCFGDREEGLTGKPGYFRDVPTAVGLP